ncbi:beta-class carbonic anhydrase [Parafrankia discariae]|uniref:beta-class carbonic anhydrase n=1 Tax=Parafrankia discariae TaxID=365528 RepID=UPI00037DFAAC|nr:carbonic anhydrase [Parafrankia discariae]
MSAPEDLGHAQGTTDILLGRAASFAARRRAAGGGGPARPASPATGVAIVACMDARINLEAIFGLAEGDAHILRNAGGVVTEDIERSLAVSQHALGTTEIILVHHTRCGMETLTDEGFRASLAERTGVRPAWRLQAFTSAAQDVWRSITVLRSSPFLRASTSVRGFVYDVETGELDEITEIPRSAAAEPTQATA